MRREELLREEIEDVRVSPNDSIIDLIEKYEKMHGFVAGSLARAVKILKEGLEEADLRFLAFTGNLVSTGLRGILAQLIEERLFNVVITTCGTVDHDIARSLAKYYKGTFFVDDAVLKELEIHRLGNVFIPFENYGPVVERFTHKMLDEIEADEFATFELMREVGKRLNDKNSILRAAYENDVHVFVPGITDGAFGTALMTYPKRRIKVDVLMDERKLADLVFPAKKLMALIIGGGISKHHTIWWAQFKEGLDYAVYVTTAIEWDGSLSGAQPREAISWGKIKPRGEAITVYGDATVIVPIIAASLLK